MAARDFLVMGRDTGGRVPQRTGGRVSQDTRGDTAQCAGAAPDTPAVVVFGAPLDTTMSFRSGARHGPRAIREYSYVLETFSMRTGQDLEKIPLFDAGDVDLAPGEVGPALDKICDAVRVILKKGGRPLMLGGEHLVTLPAVQAVHAAYPGLQVIHIDAHADMRLQYLGQELTHAGVMRRVSAIVGRENVYSAGIRSVSADEHEYARSLAANLSTSLGALMDFAARAGKRPVYLTIDIDVVDPAFAPGTGAPEPGGPSSRELLEAVATLHGLDIVAADIVEVAPQYDHAGITAALAAKVAREVIMMMARAPAS
jgi:agmatinase